MLKTQVAILVVAASLFAACGDRTSTPARRTPPANEHHRISARRGTSLPANCDARLSFLKSMDDVYMTIKPLLRAAFKNPRPTKAEAMAKLNRFGALHRDFGQAFAKLASPTSTAGRDVARLFPIVQKQSFRLLRDLSTILKYRYGGKPVPRGPVMRLVAKMDLDTKALTKSRTALYEALCRNVQSCGTLTKDPRYAPCRRGNR